MSSPRDTPFTKTNSKSIYGKTPLESWVGTVVAFSSQKDQIEGGWGWRYKVRIMGDNTNTDQITDQQLSYAYVLLPTTAGSGGAYKMRSVRISQGDFVYGVRGGGAGAPTMILGVFPRTASQSSGDGNFKNLSGFSGSLKSNKTLSGEFNEQKGPNTPGVSALDPKEQNLSNRPDPSPLLSTVGVDPKDDKVIDNLEKMVKMVSLIHPPQPQILRGKKEIQSQKDKFFSYWKIKKIMMTLMSLLRLIRQEYKNFFLILL